MNNDIDLLAIKRGSITAPAGCGKTQLIVTALKNHNHHLPLLILTHTNAGVAALKSRLKKHNIPDSNYKLATIDGWILHLVSSFPIRSAINLESLKLLTPGTDYTAIRVAAIKILNEHHVDDIIRSSYSQLIVDEYQDCSTIQHSIIVHLSKLLSTCVLGDPLQAIFSFGGNTLVDWQRDVQSYFVPSGELMTPWRWKNAGAESLGHWLLEQRKKLIKGEKIDFSKAPTEVKLVQLLGDNADYSRLQDAANLKTPSKDDSVLIIGNSKNAQSRHQVASTVYGAVTVEPVDYRELIDFSNAFRLEVGFPQLLSISKNLMTNLSGLNLESRIQTLLAGKEKKPPSPLEFKIINFYNNPTYQKAGEILRELSNQKDVRVYRPAILSACIKGLEIKENNPEISLKDAMIRIREQNRAMGRPIPKRAVGSTLLLKGLEAEFAVILDTDSLDARNLYVAMTRGSKGITICSKYVQRTL